MSRVVAGVSRKSMRLNQIEISGYRSVKELFLKLGDINVFVGPNGCGKSNIYQAIQLIQAAATGGFARRVVEEGGIQSIMWAGSRRKQEKDVVRLGIQFESVSYAIEFGRIPISERPWELEMFKNDPDVKLEEIHVLTKRKPVEVLVRKRGSINARNMNGETEEYPARVNANESVLSELREPQNYPEIAALRALMASWRFYHDFRTDLNSPIRTSRLGTMTQILSHDGHDLGSAIASIQAVGNAQRFDDAIANAFPGTRLELRCSEAGEISIFMHMPGLNRPLSIKELSDGTLQYLCLLTALLTPRPAPLMVLNEPETSIHPDLLEPLSDLIAFASKQSQIVLTTHAVELANFIKNKYGSRPIRLKKVDGATVIRGASPLRAYSVDDEEDDDDEEEEE